MSDFYNNTDNGSGSEYSYSKNQINQGESYYQWSPMDEKKPQKPKKDKTVGFGRKVFRAAVIALVFGLIAGITFQSVVFVSNKYLVADSKSSDSNNKIETTERTSEKKTTPVKETSGNAVSSSVTALDVSDLVDNVMPAIVQVTNVGIKEYQSFFGTVQQEATSCGSGIIINQDDDYIYIASNNHVVSGAEKLTITFCDDAAVEGQIKGTDSSCDLAVISVKIDDISPETRSEIKVAIIGDSDASLVGDGCVVIGNAMGYGLSVTTGVISAKEREVELTDDSGNIISNSLMQTDAAVNPGNSGGALINTNGEVIGIVSAKLSNESVEGMGYAIPVSYAGTIINKMIDNDVVSDLDAAYLGIGGKDVTSEIAAANNVPQGVYVAQVVEGSGAADAGIQVGDIITSIDGRKVNSMSTIQNTLQYLSAGTTVKIEAVTKDSNYDETKTYEVTLTHKYTDIQ